MLESYSTLNLNLPFLINHIGENRMEVNRYRSIYLVSDSPSHYLSVIIKKINLLKETHFSRNRHYIW